MKEIGDRIPFTTSIDSQIRKRLKVHCSKNDLYMNDVIEMLIDDYLKKVEEGEEHCQFTSEKNNSRLKL